MKITEKVRQEITQIEFRDDLSQDKKIAKITHLACATCVGVAIQPLTFAIMKVADLYFSHKARNEKLSEERIKAVWKQAFQQGKKQGQAQAEQLQQPED